MKDLAKKVATGSTLLMMSLSVMMTTPLYADSQTAVQEISPLDLYDGERPSEN